MKCRADLTFLVAGLAGALVWAASPMLSGYREPWDADGFYYLGALVVAGSFTGAVLPGPLWALYLGALTGQFIYEALFVKIGPLFFVGLLFLCGYSLLFVVSAAAAKQIRLHCENGSARRPPPDLIASVGADVRPDNMNREHASVNAISLAAKIGFGILLPVATFAAYQAALIGSTSGTGSWDGMGLFFGSIAIVPGLLVLNCWVIPVRWVQVTCIFDGSAYKNAALQEIGGEKETETFYKQLYSAPRFK